MPLTAIKRLVLTPVGNDLVFTMLNGLEIVVCRVSLAYLFARALTSGNRSATAQSLFATYRDDIERAASHQFDNGREHPHVK